MNEGLYLPGMSLLDFARGPALRWAVAIFVIGVVWRLGALLLYTPKDLSTPSGGTFSGGARTLLTRSAPPHELEKDIKFQHYSGYAWHISMFIVLLFGTPHMLFFKGILGFGWPTLPTVYITLFSVLTTIILLILLARRVINPVLRRISTTDDYVSWFMAFLPFLTGLMAYLHVTFGMRYETVLALHLLSISLLLVWFPFGKLMHAVFIWPSRYKVGAAFARRGVRA